MQPFETHVTVGPGGQLNLDHVPFAPGQTVRVQVQADQVASERKPFVFGLHAGMMTMSPDFDAPLPDGFWPGQP